MPKLFKLVKEEFDELHQEGQGTYLCFFHFEFNFRTITYLTITDHPGKKKGREMITKELILNLLGTNFHERKIGPRARHGQREVFVEAFVPYQNQDYLLVFGFKDNEDNHLGIRNCYLIT